MQEMAKRKPVVMAEIPGANSHDSYEKVSVEKYAFSSHFLMKKNHVD